MAPQPLPGSLRYISPEVTKVYWLTAVAVLESPDRDELDAETSVDLSGEIAAMTGWEVAGDRVAVPDLGTKKTGRISGRVNPGDAQISFYASQDTADVRDVKQRGDRGFIFIADGGDVEGQKARMFAVEVTAVTPTVGVAGTEGERVMIDYSVTDWAEQVTIPGDS